MTVKKLWDNSPFDGSLACTVGVEWLWWSWEGGWGRKAYESDEKKWALYACGIPTAAPVPTRS